MKGLEVSELSSDPARAEEWLKTAEGTMAKELDARYEPGKRRGMAKIKREREIDCVVLGWRPGKEEGTVGSLILGLYDGEDLRPVGHISGFTAAEKRGLREILAPLETGEQGPAEPSRWAGDRDLEWVALRPELVIEVGYDHASAGGESDTGRGSGASAMTRTRRSACSSILMKGEGWCWVAPRRTSDPVLTGSL